MMPWGDWQFWVVTLAAVLALVWLVRLFKPKKKRSVRTNLTINGDRPGRR